ncbi:transcriptional-regulating factor 1 [Rhinophrynus dorsalis]
MEDQQLYKANIADDNNENLYYQQLQSQASSQTLNHSFDSLEMNASESSSSSPRLSQDSRDVTLSAGTKSAEPVESAGLTNWPHDESGNHIQGRNNLDSYDQSLLWNSQAPNEITDAYQVPYFSQFSDNRHKMTTGALHKLDSFTQVFARQNLRMQSTTQVVHEQPSLMDNESDLRQLLSLKPAVEPQPRTAVVDRYQVPQHVQQNLAHQQQKHQLQAIQHQQQHFYYEYPHQVTHMQTQSLMQQGQQFLQQMQPHQVLPQQTQQIQQAHYYMPVHQTGQQPRTSIQEIQQQQHQFSGPMSQYYQAHAAGPELHHNVQPQQHHHVQLPPPAYPGDRSHKSEHYQQEQSHPMQLIQLGAVPHYTYQNSQPLRHLYKQNIAPHQQSLPQEASQQKPYHNESRSQVVMDTSVGLTNSEKIDNYNREDMGVMGNTIPHHPSLTQDPSFLMNSRGSHHSPNTTWPQHISDSRPPTVSPDHRGLYPERPEPKKCLTCSVCFKEFRSLPALNGHLRSHGGVRASTTIKQEEGEKEQVSVVDSAPAIVMPVSVPVKLALSEPSVQASCSGAKEQRESCVSEDDMPVLTRMTYSPPASPKVVSSCAATEIIRKLQQGRMKPGNREESLKPQQEKRKYRHRPEPLFIPSPSFNLNVSYCGATLYQSQLRSPRITGDHLLLRTQELPPYTPPPMLSPVRQGSGLFSNVITASQNTYLPLTPLTPTPRVLLCRPYSIDGSSTTVTPGPGEQTVDVEPRINIGSRFQANIPELQSRSSLEAEQHKATLVWKPCPDLESKESQQRVDIFLSMSCSSVLPGGGTNLEYALHSLFESNGDVMSALEMILLKKKPRLKNHPLANYHYAGSDKWTSTEKKNFNKALNTCNKDFFYVQKMIKSKTVSQCVEYYYTWKKILHLGHRHRTRLAECNEDDTTSVDDIEGEEEDLEGSKYRDEGEQVQKPPDILHRTVQEPSVVTNLGPPVGSFVCEMGNCGAIFCSRQALNGHARIHGGTSLPAKVFPVNATARQKSSAQSGYCSIKSSPAHSTTSGEIDSATVFPCKVCGKVFIKIKSRNAHMKTHRQQEEQQRQKAHKAAVAVEMANTIARTIVRTSVPDEHNILPFDHLSLIRSMEQDFDDDITQDLEDVLEETNIMHGDLLLEDEDTDLLQDDVVL